MKRRDPWTSAIRHLFIVALPLGGVLLFGCLDARPAPAAPAPAAPAPVHPTVAAPAPAPGQSPVQAAQDRIAFLMRELAAARSDLQQANADADRERILALQRICLAVAGFSLLGVFASVALWFILGGARALVTSAGLACSAVLLTALIAYTTIGYLLALLPWLCLAVAILALGGVAWGIRQLVLHRTAARTAAGAFDLLEKAVTAAAPKLAGPIVEDVKKEIVRVQDQRRVRTLLASIRGKPKPAKAAP